MGEIDGKSCVSVGTLGGEMEATFLETSSSRISTSSRLSRSRYSLWLMPKGDVRRRLAEAILDLSGKYSTSAFEPHVTLAGSIVGPAREVESKMKHLARRIPPFTIRLTTVEGLEEYFRCLFIRVALTHPIMSANEAAREIFRLPKRPAFMPHLSLLYGNLPCKEKERIIASLSRQFELEFKAATLHLYLIKRETEAWRRVASHGLGL
jgi:2'-5' RNA ligase